MKITFKQIIVLRLAVLVVMCGCTTTVSHPKVNTVAATPLQIMRQRAHADSVERASDGIKSLD